MKLKPRSESSGAFSFAPEQRSSRWPAARPQFALARAPLAADDLRGPRFAREWNRPGRADCNFVGSDFVDAVVDRVAALGERGYKLAAPTQTQSA